MKILNVNHSIILSSGGGTAERTHQMSRYLVKHNIECTILTLSSGSSLEIENLKNINLVMLPCWWNRFHVPKPLLNKIKTLIKETDLIHLTNHWTILNALVYYYARQLRKPYVICPAGSLPIVGRSKFFKKIYNFLIGKKIINNASAHIAVAKNEFSYFKKFGISEQNITLIPNGVNQDACRTHNYLPNSELLHLISKKYILFVGRLNYIKGPDLLLYAFSRLPKEYYQYDIIFAGSDGGMLKCLKKMSIELNIAERAHFVGHIEGEDKIELYRRASLLVIPSRQEAMSIVVLEAGIVGTPVLITDRCGFNEIQSINGGLEVPATIFSLQAGLIKLLTNPTKLKDLGENLRAHIIKYYTWDVIILKVIALYEKILSNPIIQNSDEKT